MNLTRVEDINPWHLCVTDIQVVLCDFGLHLLEELAEHFEG